ncbi:MAG: PRC-barrel domain-containing protein [Candidatus Kapaibacterium sp.]
MADKKINQNLYELSKLDDYEVADYEQDIKGWEVIADDGNPVGKVIELIVEPKAAKVRYIDVSIEGLGKEVLVPVGLIKIYEDDKKVVINKFSKSQLGALPIYNKQIISRADEDDILNEISPKIELPRQTPESGRESSDYYDNVLFNTEGFMRGRRRSDSSIGWSTEPHERRGDT